MKSSHTLSRRRILNSLASLGLASSLPMRAAVAQSSDKPIKFILPVAVGSGVDTITRTASPALSKALGQAVVVDNQPGAGGVVGTSQMIRSAPDGLTLSVVSNNHVIYPSVLKSLPFDPINDITPITIMGSTPLILVVNPKVPANNSKELVALLKAKGADYTYASSGNGTILHLAAAMFLDEADAPDRHVPYKGVGPMVTDLIGGHVQFGVLALPSILGHLKSGALRAIGTSAPKRLAAAPDIATFVEQGLPNYIAEGWFGVIGPKGLPASEVKRIHAAFTTAFNTLEVKEAMAKQGNTIAMTSPELAATYFKTELSKYANLVKKIGLEAQ